MRPLLPRGLFQNHGVATHGGTRQSGPEVWVGYGEPYCRRETRVVNVTYMTTRLPRRDRGAARQSSPHQRHNNSVATSTSRTTTSAPRAHLRLQRSPGHDRIGPPVRPWRRRRRGSWAIAASGKVQTPNRLPLEPVGVKRGDLSGLEGWARSRTGPTFALGYFNRNTEQSSTFHGPDKR